MKAVANDQKAKQSRLFFIGWFLILINHKALGFHYRMVGYMC